jgi:hypothetical protein
VKTLIESLGGGTFYGSVNTGEGKKHYVAINSNYDGYPPTLMINE